MLEDPVVVCAPNALKGTLSAADAARALREGVLRAAPGARAIAMPVADGGDGTREVLVTARGGEEHRLTVSDALGRPCLAAYGLVDQGRTAVIDVASASGLARLAEHERDPWRATSFGAGELVQSALERGARSLILGVGGSATVDGGTGLLSALGVRFSTRRGQPIAPGAAGLEELWELDPSGLVPSARTARIVIACDVDNPLLGPDGAARAFGPQKGADAALVEQLEAGLENLAGVLERTLGRDVRRLPFGGAAGGIAATLSAVLDAELVSGIDLVLDRLEFDRRVRDADLVLTAEGRLDAGSLRNKGPVGVARRASRAGVPAIALVGSRAPELEGRATPFHDVIVFGKAPFDLEQARRSAAASLAQAAEHAVRQFARERGV